MFSTMKSLLVGSGSDGGRGRHASVTHSSRCCTVMSLDRGRLRWELLDYLRTLLFARLAAAAGRVDAREYRACWWPCRTTMVGSVDQERGAESCRSQPVVPGGLRASHTQGSRSEPCRRLNGEGRHDRPQAVSHASPGGGGDLAGELVAQTSGEQTLVAAWL